MSILIYGLLSPWRLYVSYVSFIIEILDLVNFVRCTRFSKALYPILIIASSFN